jgi:hypothetical protein
MVFTPHNRIFQVYVMKNCVFKIFVKYNDNNKIARIRTWRGSLWEYLQKPVQWLFTVPHVESTKQASWTLRNLHVRHWIQNNGFGSKVEQCRYGRVENN